MYLIHRIFTFSHSKENLLRYLSIFPHFCKEPCFHSIPWKPCFHSIILKLRSQNGSVICTQANGKDGQDRVKNSQVQCSIHPSKDVPLKLEIPGNGETQSKVFQPMEEVYAHIFSKDLVFYLTRFLPAWRVGFFHNRWETNAACTEAPQISPGRWTWVGGHVTAGASVKWMVSGQTKKNTHSHW